MISLSDYCFDFFALFSFQRTMGPAFDRTPKEDTPPSKSRRPGESYGGGERIRTAGLLRARQALSQLSYTPVTRDPGGPTWI